MKKRLAAILMASCLVVAGLAGCGSTGTTDTDAAQSASNETVSTEGTTEAVALTLTTTFSETEFAGQVVTYFKQYLEENSGGNVTLDVYWGGTLANSSEELSFVSAGAADMSLLNQSNYTDVLPLLNFPSQIYGDEGFQGSVDIFEYVMKENEETKALIDAQNEAQNVYMLGAMPAGTNCFVSKTPCTTLADLTKLKLGAGINLSAFESLGFNVVSIMPQDYYDSLSRGIVDTGYMPISVFVSMSMQEVTPYFVCDGSYTAGNFFTINLDKWNSLSADTQQLLEDAMDATQKYSVDLSISATEDATATIEAAGGSVVYLSDEDQTAIRDALFTTSVSDAKSYAQTADCVEEMNTVLSAVSDYLGIPLE